MPTTMHIVNHNGHDTLVFDDTEAGRAEAAAAYAEQRGLGFVPFALHGDELERLDTDELVPGPAELYWLRPLVGG